MALSKTVRGRRPEGTKTPPATLELSLAVGSTRIKEADNGHEEEESEEEDEVNDACAASYWGSAVTFGFREAPYKVASPGGRT